MERLDQWNEYVYVCMYVCMYFFVITLLNSMFHYKEAILHAGDFFTSP